MKLEKAIKVLEAEVECWSLHPETDYPKALKLGIEALIREMKNRQGTFSIPLPGETEE